ncbi:hypothetical protein EYZ11_003869 [Aspergillus tanneri]|uniref:Uncharacterized protein n=1 Tax=Aspergillus tanneri TaxID=1220188 RepID=A0A4V3UQ17_9EURO|nr:hypothetical protein EYZ11_003869 [Aspergillus tanneri]
MHNTVASSFGRLNFHPLLSSMTWQATYNICYGYT